MNNKLLLKERTYTFSVDIVKFVSTFPKEPVYWTIGDQLLRSSTSIGANIIEAQAASSKKDFINYFHIALKSANETVYWLGILKDATNIDIVEVDKYLNEVKELGRILTASLLTLKKQNKSY